MAERLSRKDPFWARLRRRKIDRDLFRSLTRRDYDNHLVRTLGEGDVQWIRWADVIWRGRVGFWEDFPSVDIDPNDILLRILLAEQYEATSWFPFALLLIWTCWVLIVNSRSFCDAFPLSSKIQAASGFSPLQTREPIKWPFVASCQDLSGAPRCALCASRATRITTRGWSSATRQSRS